MRVYGFDVSTSRANRQVRSNAFAAIAIASSLTSLIEIEAGIWLGFLGFQKSPYKPFVLALVRVSKECNDTKDCNVHVQRVLEALTALMEGYSWEYECRASFQTMFVQFASAPWGMVSISYKLFIGERYITELPGPRLGIEGNNFDTGNTSPQP